MTNKTTIEIEDYKGNTIGSFQIPFLKTDDIMALDGFDIADEEMDYINKGLNLIRIQQTK